MELTRAVHEPSQAAGPADLFIKFANQRWCHVNGAPHAEGSSLARSREKRCRRPKSKKPTEVGGSRIAWLSDWV